MNNAYNSKHPLLEIFVLGMEFLFYFQNTSLKKKKREAALNIGGGEGDHACSEKPKEEKK